MPIPVPVMKSIVCQFTLGVCAVFCLFSSDANAQGAKVFIQPSRITYPAISVGQDTMKSFIIYNFDSVKTLHGSVSLPVSANFVMTTSADFVLAPRKSDTVRIH